MLEISYRRLRNVIYSVFFNYFLSLKGEKQKEKEKERDRLGSASSVSSKNSAGSEYSTTSTTQSHQKHPPEPTWIHDIFEGTLTNETRCLCCETVG